MEVLAFVSFPATPLASKHALSYPRGLRRREERHLRNAQATQQRPLELILEESTRSRAAVHCPAEKQELRFYPSNLCYR